MIRLRPHHLLCLQTYIGKGYSAEFVAGYERIVTRLNAGEEVEIIEGPDDICAPLLSEQTCPHCHNDSVLHRDALAAREIARLIGRDLEIGHRMSLDRSTLARLRAAFAEGRLRSACQSCPWSALCDEIAEGGFAQTRLHPLSG